MGNFLTENSITIFFGITTVITSLAALHYKRLEHRQQVEHILDGGRRAGLFLSRAAMITYLLEMYDKADAEDVIWAQCVRCTDFTEAVRAKILEAAGRGARFQMVINCHSPAVEDFHKLFDPIASAQVLEADDNALSVQGLSDHEVVIALPGVTSYTAVLIRDPYFVKIIRDWFDNRLTTPVTNETRG